MFQSADNIERTQLLSKAIEICTTLSTLLEAVGPRRPISSNVGDSGEDRRLEDELHLKLQGVSEKRNAILSPVFQLPDDLLRAIFSVNDLDMFARAEDLDAYVLSISRVCRRWRAVSVETSTLWTRVNFSPRWCNAPYEHEGYHPLNGRHRHGELSGRNALFLSRAKASLLNVTVEVSKSPECLTLLERYGMICEDRVQALYLTAHGVVNVAPFIVITRSTLKDLELQFFDWQQSEDDHEGFGCFSNFLNSSFPLLEAVSLVDAPLSQHSDIGFASLASCRKLRLVASDDTRLSSDCLFIVLRSCPELQELHLHILYNMGPPAMIQLGERVSLPKLQVYKVEMASPSPFSFIKAPILRELGLAMGWSDEPEDCTALISAVREFLRVSSAPVHVFHATNLQATCMPGLLEDLPQVTDVTIAASTPATRPDAFIEFCRGFAGLTAMNYINGKHICPRLERLTYGFPADTALLVALFKLAYRRNSQPVAGVARIRRVEIVGWVTHGSDGLPWGADEALQLEGNLAAELDELVIGGLLFDKAARGWRRGGKPVLKLDDLTRGA